MEGIHEGMTPQEKALYQQIHPLKLATDITAEFVSLYLFWHRKWTLGWLAFLIPPIITSSLLIKRADLEPYKKSKFGKYVLQYMSPTSVTLRILGTIVSHIGAWYRKPLWLPIGWGLVVLGWVRGLLWPEQA